MAAPTGVLDCQYEREARRRRPPNKFPRTRNGKVSTLFTVPATEPAAFLPRRAGLAIEIASFVVFLLEGEVPDDASAKPE
jgi:hypothetical protein